MACPYCGVGFRVEWDEYTIPVSSNEDEWDEGFNVKFTFCPECNNFIIRLQKGTDYDGEDITVSDDILVYPKFPISKQLNKYVPEKYRDLFTEASQVNSISPRASATLSRYLLQMILHEGLNIKKKNLEQEIIELEAIPHIPTPLVSMLQIMRRIANFGAHPKKSTNSNEIVEVESGEADVMLQLLEELLDFVFVKPKQQDEFMENIKEKYGITP